MPGFKVKSGAEESPTSSTSAKKAASPSRNSSWQMGMSISPSDSPSRSRHGSAVIEKMIEKMTEEMKEKLDVSISIVNREIAALKKKRAVERKGGDKNGSWVVLILRIAQQFEFPKFRNLRPSNTLGGRLLYLVGNLVDDSFAVLNLRGPHHWHRAPGRDEIHRPCRLQIHEALHRHR